MAADSNPNSSRSFKWVQCSIPQRTSLKRIENQVFTYVFRYKIEFNLYILHLKFKLKTYSAFYKIILSVFCIESFEICIKHCNWHYTCQNLRKTFKNYIITTNLNTTLLITLTETSSDTNTFVYDFYKNIHNLIHF